MGADGAEVGVSRKRAAENAPSASDPEQRGGKKARHAAKHAAARVERIEQSEEADSGGFALKAKGQAQRERSRAEADAATEAAYGLATGGARKQKRSRVERKTGTKARKKKRGFVDVPRAAAPKAVPNGT